MVDFAMSLKVVLKYQMTIKQKNNQMTSQIKYIYMQWSSHKNKSKKYM